jgi:hypothetical protein
MIKLKDAGERGGTMTVEMSPFDARSLQEGLTSAIIHLEHLLEDGQDNEFIKEIVPAKIKDALANFNELENALADRESIMKERGE